MSAWSFAVSSNQSHSCALLDPDACHALGWEDEFEVRPRVLRWTGILVRDQTVSAKSALRLWEGALEVSFRRLLALLQIGFEQRVVFIVVRACDLPVLNGGSM